MGFSLAAYRARQRMVAENAREALQPAPATKAPQKPVYEFRAPYAVSANRYWRTVRNGQRMMMVPTTEAKRYKEQVRCLALAAGIDAPITGRVELELCLHPVEPLDADRRREKYGPDWHHTVRSIDTDNVCKVLVDSLQGVAYVNDKQIWTLIVQRGLPVPDGGVTVKVREIADALA